MREIQKLQRNHQNSVLGVTFLGKTPPIGISRQNSLLNNFIRSTGSHLQYTNGFSSTSENTRIKKFFELHFRGAIGEIQKNYPLEQLVNRSTDFDK
jgi:hypothetical protein